MVLSDISIKRPVFATVINLVLMIGGVFAFDRLTVREVPDIDRPIISVTTTYRGASANIIESQVTQIVEDGRRGDRGHQHHYVDQPRGIFVCLNRIQHRPRHRCRRK